MGMKRIGISQRVIEASQGAKRDGLEQTYPLYFESFGVTLIPVPNVLRSPAKYLQDLGVEAIILSGGNDVHPSLYGEAIQTDGTYAPERDATERAMLDYATHEFIPTLCICRGLQFLNVYFGGKLAQVSGHVARPHEVSLLSLQLFGTHKKEMTVNSTHQYAIPKTMLASVLKPFCECGDQTIEGVYHPQFPMAGIMWHPERLSPNDEFNKTLIQAFVRNESFWAVSQKSAS